MENEREKFVPPRKAQEINESDQMNIPGAGSLLIENETPQDKTLSNKDINTVKITYTSESKNAFSPAPQSPDKEKRAPKIDKHKRSKKKPKAIKNTKLSSPRIKRKMARQFEKENGQRLG